jgi:hypothetical protein
MLHILSHRYCPCLFCSGFAFLVFFEPNNPNRAKANLHANLHQFSDNNLNGRAYPNDFFDGSIFGGMIISV